MADDKPRKPGPLTILRAARERQETGPQANQGPPAGLGGAKDRIEAVTVPAGGKPSPHEALTAPAPPQDAGVHERVTVKPRTIQPSPDAALKTKDLTLEERVGMLERRLEGYNNLIEITTALLDRVESLFHEMTEQEKVRAEVAERFAKPFMQMDEKQTAVDPDAFKLLKSKMLELMALVETRTNAYRRFEEMFGPKLKAEVDQLRTEIDGIKTGMGIRTETQPQEQKGFFARLFGK